MAVFTVTRRRRRQREQRLLASTRERDRRARGALVRRPPWDTLPDDLDGGAGVREPRRPMPSAPPGSLALELPR